MNLRAFIFFFVVVYSAFPLLFIPAGGMAFAAMQDPQALLKSEVPQAAQNDKRIMLNIPRGGPKDEGKLTLGAEPVFKTQIKRGDMLLFGKDVGFVSGIVDTRGLGSVTYSLKDCIEIAIKNHLPLQTAKKSVKLAEMRLFEARRNMLPSATINFEEYSGRVNGLRYIGRKQTIDGQQPVFHGGELFYTMKQSEINLEITKTDYSRIRNELILQVKKAYYTLVKAKGNSKMQEGLSKEVDRILDMVTRQSEAGITSKLEVLNVTSQAGQIKYQLVSAEGDLSVAELILKQAMNVDEKARIDVNEDLEFEKVVVDYEKTLSIAMVNRPEMRINSLMIDYYNCGKGIARAKLSPKLDILGSWGLFKEEYAGDDLGDQVDQKLEQQWYAGIKASLPIWGSTAEYSWTAESWPPAISTFRGTEAKTSSYKFKFLDKLDSLSDRKLSEIDFDKARQELTKIRQEITLEVKESCFNYQKALIQSDTAANKVKYQTSDLDLVKLKRGLDEAQDSNVIDSMIKLAQEQFGLLQALADCHTALAGINKAIGIEDYYNDE